LSTKRKYIRRKDLRFPKPGKTGDFCNQYNVFIKQFVDRYNYGHINGEGSQSFKFGRDDINEVWAGKGWLSHIDLQREEHIKPHLQREKVYFYTSNPYCKVGMFVIDLDATDTSKYCDIEQAAEYIIENYHPGAYYDQSTHGEGIHLYVFLDVSDFVPSRFSFASPLRLHNMHLVSDYLRGATFQGRPGKSYAALLKELIEVVDLDCEVCDIKGTFSSYSSKQYKEGYGLANRGNLCKLPWPLTEREFMELVNAPILSFDDIVNNTKRIEEEIKRLRWELDGWEESSVATEQSASAPSTHPEADETTDSDPQPGLEEPIRQEPRKHNGNAQDVYERCYDSDAFIRTRRSVQCLARELGRVPAYDEWCEFYVRHGLNASQESPRRKSRFEDCVKYVAQTFDPTTGNAVYEVGEFLADIKERITEQELYVLGDENCRITHEDVDTAVGLHWTCISQQGCDDCELFEVKNSRMIGWFRNLKAQGLSKGSCWPNKVGVLRKALLKIGYITEIDPRWKKGVKGKGNGKGKRYGIGQNFPRYQEYVQSGKADLEARLTSAVESQLNDAKGIVASLSKEMVEIRQQIEKLTEKLEQVKAQEASIQDEISFLRHRQLPITEGALEHHQNLLRNPDWNPIDED
jgi:hypothetical protein